MFRFNMFKTSVLLLIVGTFLSVGFANNANRPAQETSGPATSVVTVPATIVSVVPATGLGDLTSTTPSAVNVTVIPSAGPENVTNSTSVVTTILNGTTGASSTETPTTAPDLTTSIVPVTSIITSATTKNSTSSLIPPRFSTTPQEPQSADGAAGLATSSFIGLTASAFLIFH